MKILFLQKRPLFPTDTGGKIRTLNVIRYLAKWHEVTYLCNLQPSESDAVDPMKALGLRLETIPWRETPRGTTRFYCELASNLASRHPFNVDKDFDARLRTRAKMLLENEEFDLVICDFVQMARNVLGLPTPPSILFQHNVEAEIFERHASTDRGWLRRAYLGHQYRKMNRFEYRAGLAFDKIIAVSERDKEIFAKRYGWGHVEVIDTAVDTDYFQPVQQQEADDRVVFVGSLDWLPNREGVEFFVHNIWPKIRVVRPNARFQIVGRNPDRNTLKLGSQPGVEVVGTVPDVRPYLAQATVVIVPLHVGGGTRLKIYEAMAMGKAVVSTRLGAEGLQVQHDENIVLADEANELADAVVQLLADKPWRDRIAQTARRLVATNFSAGFVARQFSDICERVVNDAAATNQQPSATNLDVPCHT